MHDAAVATVRTVLGKVQALRDGYASTMASAESSMATMMSEVPLVVGNGAAGGANPPTERSGLTVTKGDLAIGAAGAVAGGTAEGVRQATTKLINDSPGTGPGKADPRLLRWLEDPTIGGVELKGFSRLGGLVAAASAVPAVMSDIHDGNSVTEAVTRETVGTGAGLWAGAAAGGFLADVAAGGAIGSVVPGAGTMVGVVAGAVVGAGAALLASKTVELAWDPVAEAVGSVFDFG